MVSKSGHGDVGFGIELLGNRPRWNSVPRRTDGCFAFPPAAYRRNYPHRRTAPECCRVKNPRGPGPQMARITAGAGVGIGGSGGGVFSGVSSHSAGHIPYPAFLVRVAHRQASPQPTCTGRLPSCSGVACPVVSLQVFQQLDCLDIGLKLCGPPSPR